MFKQVSSSAPPRDKPHRGFGGVVRLRLLEPDLGVVSSPLDVHGLELVKSGEHAGTSDTTQDVSSGSLHQRHEALVLRDLEEAVHGALVLDATAGGHHHPPPHGVNGVGHEPSSDSDSPSEEERH